MHCSRVSTALAWVRTMAINSCWKTKDNAMLLLLLRTFSAHPKVVARDAFSSPEPVVSWSRGRETRGSGSSRYRMSENFWHPVAHVQKLQISLLMLITDFCPSPLHWGKNFTSWALSREWLLWGVLKMHHFTQLGFTDNLGLKEEDRNRNQPNTLLVCRTETINRQTIIWVMWVFFSILLVNKQWESNIAKIDNNAGKSQSEKVSCSMSCDSSYWLQNAFWNETIHELC